MHLLKEMSYLNMINLTIHLMNEWEHKHFSKYKLKVFDSNTLLKIRDIELKQHFVQISR